MKALRTASAATLVCVWLLAGCSKPAEPAASTPAPVKGRGVAPQNVATAEAPAAPPKPGEGPGPEELPAANKAAADAARAAAAAKAAEAKKKPRDFSDELLRSMTGATSCLKPRTASAPNAPPPSIDIAMTAHVMPSGGVGRGEVSSAALDAQELTCVKRQLEALHFAAPIENAPFAVSASLHINAVLQPPPAAGPAAQPAQNDDAPAAPEAAY